MLSFLQWLRTYLSASHGWADDSNDKAHLHVELMASHLDSDLYRKWSLQLQVQLNSDRPLIVMKEHDSIPPFQTHCQLALQRYHTDATHQLGKLEAALSWSAGKSSPASCLIAKSASSLHGQLRHDKWGEQKHSMVNDIYVRRQSTSSRFRSNLFCLTDPLEAHALVSIGICFHGHIRCLWLKFEPLSLPVLITSGTFPLAIRPPHLSRDSEDVLQVKWRKSNKSLGAIFRGNIFVF